MTPAPHLPAGLPAARRPRGAAGFTFLELMVVITIVGMLSAIVVANLDGLTHRSSLNASARAFGNLVLGSRDMAAIHGRESRIEIDLREQRWRTVDPPSPNDVPDLEEREEATIYGDWQVPVEGVLLEDLAFSRDDVANRNEVVTISFDADGQLTPSGFVVYFRHQDIEEEEDGVSVEVTGLTGLVDYARGRRRAEEVREEDDF